MFELIKLGLPKSKGFILGLVVSVLQGVSAVALLATSAWLISRASEQPPVMYLMVAVVGVRGFALGRAAFRYAERITLHDAAFKMLAQVRPKLYEKIIPFAPAGLGAESHGDLLTRVGSDTDELQNLPLRVISPLVQSVAVSLLTVVGMWILLPSAGLSLFIALAATFLIALPISGKISERADRNRAKTYSVLSTNSLDLLENLDVLRAYGWLESSLQEIRNTDELIRQQTKTKSLAIGVGQSLFSLIATGATVATSFFGAQVVAGGQQPGVLLALFMLIPMALFDVVLVAQPAVNSWQAYRASAARILEFQTRPVPPELQPDSGFEELGEFRDLEFNGVSLAYPGKSILLENFDFKINGGQTVAITGPSGSGKSSIALALLRFLDIGAGEYLVNGQDISKLTIDSVRRTIGLVEQNPTIFMGNVRSNLLIANSEASDQDLWQVLDHVGLARLFESREGLETELGDRGVLISGGESQRLALARAILADFSVVILDEPTSNVDQKTGVQLVTDLLNAAKQKENRCVILVTHDSQLASLTDLEIKLPQRSSIS